MGTDIKQPLCVRAYAKINLFLDVTERRADGYHLVNMAMQTLALHDELIFSVRDGQGDRPAAGEAAFIGMDTLRIEDADGSGRFAGLETDGRNLVLRAVRAIRDRCGQRIPPGAGLDILLRKRIPTEAGLAGGSADAAAALLALDRLFSLGLDREALTAIALSLGADVPYCLFGGTMRAEGIGEILTPLPPLPACAIVLAKPAGSASTKEIYAAIDGQKERAHPSWDGFESALAERPPGVPGRKLAAGQQAAGARITALAGQLANVMEPVTASMLPDIEAIRDLLLASGALGARMTGSGSVVFGLFADEEAAARAAGRLRGESVVRELFVTRPITADAILRERFF